MFTRFSRPLIAMVAVAAIAPAARATIGFNVTGLAGSGVTAHVDFTYASTSATAGTLRFNIENTTSVGGRISAFVFNVPTIGGTTFSSIAGSSHGNAITLSPPSSQVTPENQTAGYHESGWYGFWQNNSVPSLIAGNFDLGIGSASQRIRNDSNSNDSTSFVMQLSGTGLNTGNAAIEQAFMSALSSGGHNFAVLFSDIANSLNGHRTDLAGSAPVAIVPAPGAAALGALGLALVGWARRRAK